MRMNKRYQIFLSSTYKDLEDERNKVIMSILKMYHLPIGMEMFHADNEEQWVQIKNTIDMSDYYILILGRYCGTVIKEENVSYTEKEYNYALSKGIPVLSFVMSDDALQKSYGIESVLQQRIYKKFKKKVLQLPCEFWVNQDDLAAKVTSTLNAKFSENTQHGWVPYNEFGFIDRLVDPTVIGIYNVYYYSCLNSGEERFIKSNLEIHENGDVYFSNNTNGANGNAEFEYKGVCRKETDIIYLFLKNQYSNERALISLVPSVGKLDRYIGIISALSSNGVPVSIKLACFKEAITNNINFSILKNLLTKTNSIWDKHLLTIEESEKHLFFSDAIIQANHK